MTRPTRLLLPAVTAALLAAAGCGSMLQTVPAREAPAIGAPAAAALSGIATTATAVGTVVTSDGFTVYRYDKDRANPSTSTCTGACTKSWPPVLGDGTPRLQGVPERLVGTVGRPDGTQQLTIDGWPVYRSSKDTRPGDVAGAGASGTWWTIGADGKKLGAAQVGAPKVGAPPVGAPPVSAPSVRAPSAPPATADVLSSGY